jgi:predicted negative regulator of RcsB-dependent stress response
VATNLSKKDVKTDLLTQELKKGFQWTTSHTRLVGLTVVGLLLAGGAMTLMKHFSEKAEVEVQEKYFQVEREFIKKKEAFEKYELAQKTKLAKKDKKAAPLENGEKPSGNLDKDYGPALSSMNEIIIKYPSSKAAHLAALTLSETLMKYHQPGKALETLQQVKTGGNTLSAMVMAQLGSAQANLKDCPSAVQTWSKVLSIKTADFIHPEILLRQGLCFEAMNDKVKAEESYNKIIAEGKEGSVAKTAEKYLRLLKSHQ